MVHIEFKSCEKKRANRHKKKNTAQSVDRALRILVEISELNKAVGLSEISRNLHLDKSTALRLLNSLEESDFLQRSISSRRYVLGWRALQLTKSWHLDIRTVCRPVLQRLAEHTNETVGMVARRGYETVRIEAIDPSADVGLVYRLGSSAPLHAGASGKAILANLPEAEFETLLNSALRPLTSRTVIDPMQLRFEAEQIRKLGYAICVEGHTLGVAAVAAPVFDYEGGPIGAVAISGPLGRFNKEVIESLIEPLKESAAGISKILGHQLCTPRRARIKRKSHGRQ